MPSCKVRSVEAGETAWCAIVSSAIEVLSASTRSDAKLAPLVVNRRFFIHVAIARHADPPHAGDRNTHIQPTSVCHRERPYRIQQHQEWARQESLHPEE